MADELETLTVLSDATRALVLQAQTIRALEISLGNAHARIRALEENIDELGKNVLVFVDAWKEWVDAPELMPSSPVLRATETLEAYAAKIRD